MHREFFTNDDYGLVGGDNFDEIDPDPEVMVDHEKMFLVLKPY